MSFVQRLVLGTVLLLVLATGVLLIAAERSLRRGLDQTTIRALARDGALVAEALPRDSTAWQPTIRRLGRVIGRRITLIDPAGRVRAASNLPADSLALAENLAATPDVATVLTGLAAGHSDTASVVDAATVFVTMPGGPGAIRLSADRSPTIGLVHRARGAMLGAALLALVVGVIAAAAAARSVTRPLNELAGAARDIAAGSAPRFPRSPLPEVETLVAALRRMNHELSVRFQGLRRERAESTALVEAMIEGVIATDARGRIVTANSAARRLLGYGSEASLPDLPELFRAKAARAVVATVLGGTPVQDRQLDLDGRALLVNARPFHDGGALLVLHDLTELRRLEAVRRDFVANVSHELKTPLTSIAGYTETLVDDTPDAPTTRRFLEIIRQNARRMHRLVDDLLDLARIESGRWHPAVERVDGATLARECWTALGDRAATRGVTLATATEPPGTLVPADPDAMRQILTNLLDNAARYSPSGGRITCTVHGDVDGVTLAIADQGAGIPREHLPRIFERFYRVDPSRSREEGGTGLGLAIVKHLVEAHGGRASVTSELGAGTTVTCWFPA